MGYARIKREVHAYDASVPAGSGICIGLSHLLLKVLIQPGKKHCKLCRRVLDLSATTHHFSDLRSGHQKGSFRPTMAFFVDLALASVL